MCYNRYIVKIYERYGVYMKRFDLGMSINYCPMWGIVEAVREFFQNAFDAQTANPENKMYFAYDADENALRIGNKDGYLPTRSLLLGQTSKTGKDEMIGQHGEGYKVATVVLLRNGKTVKVYNRSEREVWTAKVIKSRRYQADVVVFDVEKASIFKSFQDNDLVFEIGGIDADEYKAIVDSNLHLQELKPDDVVYSGKSRILLDASHKGKLYVGGLFVQTSKYATMGYDFEPSLVTLDRDRSFIDGLDLQFLCGKLICATNNLDFIRKCRDIWDGSYVRFYLDSYCKSDYNKLYEDAYVEFKEKNGKDAVPVKDTDTFNSYKRNGINAVMTTDNIYHYVTSYSGYTPTVLPEEKKKETLATALEEWFDTYVSPDSEGYEKGEEIVEAICKELREE